MSFLQSQSHLPGSASKTGTSSSFATAASPFGTNDSVPFLSLDGTQRRQGRLPSDDAEGYPNYIQHKKYQHLYVLPVLLLEFLALALTRAVLPALLLKQYGSQVYLVLGCSDAVRGLLAFIACPLFGKISDIVGRKACLLVTVLGTCAPVCCLALFPWERQDPPPDNTIITDNNSINADNGSEDKEGFWSMIFPKPDDNDHDFYGNQTLPPSAITIFVVLLALSGIFSSTFTLVFAYISDTVRQQDERVSAYGLALATFGLSFTIGPMAGGYLARTNTHSVFVCSLVLTVIDLLYIYFVLPESKEGVEPGNIVSSTASVISMDHKFSWSPVETLRVISVDPFLRRVGQVAFLYYTGLWAIISTLSIYAVKRFHLGPERLGELMSALGLCTMVAEAVLVRIMVPLLGEKRAMKFGLVAFILQCIVLGFAYESWHLFVCAAFSLGANLVYPSLSSLVSGSVEPDSVGEALGAVNGVKALTEGIGPLVFGTLMTFSEHSMLPGWPYLLAAFLVYFAYKAADDLPDPEDDDYIHEMDRKHNKDINGGIMLQRFIKTTPKKPVLSLYSQDRDDGEDQGLLSDIDESEFDTPRQEEDEDGEDVSRLPITFASLVNMPPP